MFRLLVSPNSAAFSFRQCLYLLALPVLFLFSCNSGEKIPDVSAIKVDLQTQRFDRDLAALDTNQLPAGVVQLRQKYPDFLDFYLDTLMGFNIHGNYSDTAKGMIFGLRGFLTHKDYRGVFDTVAVHYPDTKTVDAALTSGFRFMKYYYPNYQVPRIIYLVSGLNNWGAFTDGDNIIGVGLDMFLGGSYPFYAAVGLPDYLTEHLTPQYIPVAVFSAVYQSKHPFEMDNKALLEMMLERGRQQYFLHHILPRTADSTLFGYTQKQLDWCHDNEGETYNFFIKQNLLYDKEFQKVARYVNDGPNSTGMPAQSPGNIGTWVGYQIVSSYMQRHKDVTLQQLMAQQIDAERFLVESRYKPK